MTFLPFVPTFSVSPTGSQILPRRGRLGGRVRALAGRCPQEAFSQVPPSPHTGRAGGRGTGGGAPSAGAWLPPWPRLCHPPAGPLPLGPEVPAETTECGGGGEGGVPSCEHLASALGRVPRVFSEKPAAQLPGVEWGSEWGGGRGRGPPQQALGTAQGALASGSLVRTGHSGVRTGLRIWRPP